MSLSLKELQKHAEDILPHKHDKKSSKDAPIVAGTGGKTNYRVLPNLRFAYAMPLVLLVAGIGIYSLLFSQAAVAPIQVNFEGGSTSSCTGGVNTTPANTTFTPTTAKAYEGSYSAEANYTGGTENAYARCVVTTSWSTGDDVWYGSAIFLPTGFAAAMQNQVDLMRWDNFSLNNASQDWGGLIIQNSDKKARLKKFNVDGDYTDLSTPFSFPENKWVWVEMRQKLSPTDGQAINEVWIDGALQSSSTTANTYGRDVTRLRYGLVAIGGGSQTNPLNLWVDRATISTSKVGPLSTSPSCNFGSFGTNNWPPACAVPFASSSPWNTPIPANPTLLSGSAQKVEYLTGLGPPQPSPIGTSLTKDYQHPYYLATTSDPIVTIQLSTNWDGNNVQGRKIRIPKDAQVAGGGDGHITIVQPISDYAISADVLGYSVGLYDATAKPAGGWVNGGTISAVSGGKSHILTGSGIDAGNTTAASFNNLAGIIRAQEMSEGVINHALFGIVRCTNGHVYPVPNSNEAETCSDGLLPGGYTVNSGGNSVPLGARLWLDMTPAQIDALSVPTWKKTILKAAAKYGVLIGDTGAYGNSTFSFGFMFESSATYTSFGALDQMSAFAASNGFIKSSDLNYPYSAALGNITDSTGSSIWSKYLKVVDPCVSNGTCPGTTPTPTITLSANPTTVSSGGTSALTWSTTNATSCTASGGWSGTKATNGTNVSTGVLTATTTFTLNCTGAGGSTSASTTVTVSATAPTCPAKAGDVNGDGSVNITDIGLVLSSYGQTTTTNCADLDISGTVNIQDLSIILSKYGT